MEKYLITCTMGLVQGIIQTSHLDLSLYNVIPHLHKIEKISLNVTLTLTIITETACVVVIRLGKFFFIVSCLSEY